MAFVWKIPVVIFDIEKTMGFTYIVFSGNLNQRLVFAPQKNQQVKRKILFFADDNIVGSDRPEDDERAMSLFEGMIRSRVNKIWGSQVSINVAKNPEMLRLMRKAGCRSLLIGFEQIDDSALKIRGKHQKQERLPLPIRYRSDHPYDSKPFPGARLFEQYKPELCWHDFPKDWERFDFSQLVISPTAMSMEEFYRLRHDMVLQTHSLLIHHIINFFTIFHDEILACFGNVVFKWHK